MKAFHSKLQSGLPAGMFTSIKMTVAAILMMTFVLTSVTIAVADEPVVGKKADTKKPDNTNDKPSFTRQVVQFSSGDNELIEGDLIVPSSASKSAPAPVVVLLHMYLNDRSSYDPLIPKLAEKGFVIMAIDMRGHGKSMGKSRHPMRKRVEMRDSFVFAEMKYDVEGAINYLTYRRDVDLSRLAIVGASVGCSVALDYASVDPTVDAIVCLTPGTNYLGLDSTAAIPKIKGRNILLLASEEERTSTDILAGMNSEVTKRIVGKGRIHGTRMFGKIENIEEEIADYLVKSVGNTSKNRVQTKFGTKSYFSDAAVISEPEKVRWFSSKEEAARRGVTAKDR